MSGRCGVSNDSEVRFARKFGGWMRRERSARKLSRLQMATLLGVSRNAIGDWEAGITLPNIYRVTVMRNFFREHPPASASGQTAVQP